MHRTQAIRPAALLLACTALGLLLARPAAAAPVAPAVPDVGSAPIAAGGFRLPAAATPGSGSATAATTVATAAPQPGPLGQQIMALSTQLESLGQQLLQVSDQLTAAQQAAQAAATTLATARSDLADLRARADNEAAAAYRAAAALGPLGGYASDLHQLSVLAPGIGAQPGGSATALDVSRAEQAVQDATLADRSATATVDELTRQRAARQSEYDRTNATLTDLRTRNATAYEQQLAAIDAQQAAIGAGLNVGGAVDGMTAGPVAQKAVAAAKTRLGRPYVWGAAGPDFFDCSGLVLWSYRQAGFDGLPRVADDQYAATRNNPVAVDKLLPGDLLFFATDKADWRSIHHVAMYVGNGYMIQAPSTGDVVKISPIWWSEFYGATRVDRAVRGEPKPTSAPPPPGGGSGSGGSPSPSTGPSSPSGPPSKTPSPSPSHSPTPSPTPSPTASGSASTSPSHSASASPSDSASASHSASASAGSSARPAPHTAPPTAPPAVRRRARRSRPPGSRRGYPSGPSPGHSGTGATVGAAVIMSAAAPASGAGMWHGEGQARPSTGTRGGTQAWEDEMDHRDSGAAPDRTAPPAVAADENLDSAALASADLPPLPPPPPLGAPLPAGSDDDLGDLPEPYEPPPPPPAGTLWARWADFPSEVPPQQPEPASEEPDAGPPPVGGPDPRTGRATVGRAHPSSVASPGQYGAAPAGTHGAPTTYRAGQLTAPPSPSIPSPRVSADPPVPADAPPLPRRSSGLPTRTPGESRAEPESPWSAFAQAWEKPVDPAGSGTGDAPGYDSELSGGDGGPPPAYGSGGPPPVGGPVEPARSGGSADGTEPAGRVEPAAASQAAGRVEPARASDPAGQGDQARSGDQDLAGERAGPGDWDWAGEPAGAGVPAGPAGMPEPSVSTVGRARVPVPGAAAPGPVEGAGVVHQATTSTHTYRTGRPEPVDVDPGGPSPYEPMQPDEPIQPDEPLDPGEPGPSPFPSPSPVPTPPRPVPPEPPGPQPEPGPPYPPAPTPPGPPPEPGPYQPPTISMSGPPVSGASNWGPPPISAPPISAPPVPASPVSGGPGVPQYGAGPAATPGGQYEQWARAQRPQGTVYGSRAATARPPAEHPVEYSGSLTGHLLNQGSQAPPPKDRNTRVIVIMTVVIAVLIIVGLVVAVFARDQLLGVLRGS